MQEKLGGQDMALFGVFDGHGQEGKVVSHTICQNLPKIMSRLVSGKVSFQWHQQQASCSVTLGAASKVSC